MAITGEILGPFDEQGVCDPHGQPHADGDQRRPMMTTAEPGPPVTANDRRDHGQGHGAGDGDVEPADQQHAELSDRGDGERQGQEGEVVEAERREERVVRSVQ